MTLVLPASTLIEFGTSENDARLRVAKGIHARTGPFGVSADQMVDRVFTRWDLTEHETA